MKKAEEYLKECDFDGHFISVEAFLSAVKKAQIDAINETVDKCADSANTMIVKEGNNYHRIIDKKSILKVAEQLRKEII